MQKEIQEIARQLNLVADTYENAAQSDQPTQLSLLFMVGNTKLTIKCDSHPKCIRERAERLIKQCRRTANMTTGSFKECSRASNWKNSLSRPKQYSKRVAQEFLDNGERDNWQAYVDLFS